jgi:hypothetical protein
VIGQHTRGQHPGHAATQNDRRAQPGPRADRRLVRTDLGEKSPCELYNISEEEMEAFQEAFWLWGNEYGFHTITQIVEVNISNKLI